MVTTSATGGPPALGAGELMQTLHALGFERHTPRTSTWKAVLTQTNPHGQALFVMISLVGVDLKVYADGTTLKFDERGRLYTHGGEMHRLRHDTMSDGLDLHRLIAECAKMFAAGDRRWDDQIIDACRNRETWCKLCLFDLDNTLLKTNDLEQFRGLAHVTPEGSSVRSGGQFDKYSAELLKAVASRDDRHLYRAESLVELRRRHPLRWPG